MLEFDKPDPGPEYDDEEIVVPLAKLIVDDGFDAPLN